jgi:DNA-binding SARP family transcriptional activator
VAILQFYSLGPLDIRSDDRQFPRPPTQKSQSLLAYLVIHRSQPQPRDLLAGLFFNQTTERKAHRSLSTALWHIHRCLPEEATILSDPQTVQFNPQNNIWLDAEEFEQQAARTDAASLQRAVNLYRCDFLEGLYDDWIISERYRLESIYLEALARLMVLYEAGKDYPSALATALRLLSRDSLREDAHQAAMRAYSHLGQRKAALAEYERCREILLKELGAEPMVETRDLYQSILRGNFEVKPLPGLLPIQNQPAAPVGHDPLDVTATVRLTGREQETLFLEDCWRKAQARNCILALIGGEAGVGKTRLVEDFANCLRWQNLRVLWGRCYEFERILPYQPISDALRMALFAIANNEVVELPAWVQREIARLVPELLDHPGMRKEPSEMHRKTEDRPTPELPIVPGLNPEQARLFSGITDFLARLSVQSALLIVLEDLHWASESTLQLLHHLVRSLSSHPVLIIGTFRSEEVGPRHPLRTMRRQLAQERLVEQLELYRLSPYRPSKRSLGRCQVLARWFYLWRNGCTGKRKAIPSF